MRCESATNGPSWGVFGTRRVFCLRLRVKDLGFDRLQVTVRDGKGEKDRVTLLPKTVVEPLKPIASGAGNTSTRPIGLRSIPVAVRRGATTSTRRSSKRRSTRRAAALDWAPIILDFWC